MEASLRVAVTGSSGMVGTALVASLVADGHEVLRLVRRPPRDESEVQWEPRAGLARPRDLDGCDALIALQGANIAGGRWTRSRKQILTSSRVDALRSLALSMADLEQKPRIVLSASGAGIYGVHPEGAVHEQSPHGEGFLAELAQSWEEAAGDLGEALGAGAGFLRFGVVLSPRGGALAKMLPVYRMGLGGVLGDGESLMSWISLDDAVAAIRHVLLNRLDGAFNVVAPECVSQSQFTEVLGSILRRPTLLPVPALLLRALLGQMAEETLLANQHVLPSRLLESGFSFRYGELEPALRHLLDRPA